MSLATLKRLVSDQNPLRLLWHKSKALMAAVRYGFPAKKLTVIGITGTDGKTTTVGMIAHILHENGIKVGALSTAFFRIKDHVEWNATQKTSPSPFIIQKFLRRLVDEGCTHAVMEYSSHGLVQGRMLFTYPTIAGITNISEEHLDYHGTMEEYIRAKAKLFQMLTTGWTAVLHYSDRSYTTLLSALPYHKAIHENDQMHQTLVYNEHLVDVDDKIGPPMNFWMTDEHVTPTGSQARVTWHTHSPVKNDIHTLTLQIPGAFNLLNALCAIACCKGIPLPMEGILKALETFRGIPGRMERIDEGQNFGVYIDFTVTPQSYEATLSTLKKMLPFGKRLLVLTGSCGDRMKEKRPIVGKIVSNYADVMVVANEDPYTEDPEKIIDEVWAGIDQSKTQAHRIFDRRKAIEFLLHEAKEGDIVILCGKGSDTTMWVKDGQIPWNERAIAKEILKTL